MMTKKPIRLRSVLCSAFALVLSGTSQAADPAEAKTIGRAVRDRPELSTFLQLLEKTEAGSQLSEKTDIRRTVFAPTNAALAKLPEAAIKTLLDPRNDDRLDEVFGFHILSRQIPAFGLEQYSTLQMSTGQFLSIDYKGGTIGEARFSGESIACSNGTIYLIDSVLTPNTDDLFQTLQKDGRFKIFTKAITASRQGKRFQNVHSLYTAFAPTDEAFAKLPKEFVESLFLPENDERLEDIIKHHITEKVRGAGAIPKFFSLGTSNITPISAFGQQLNFKVGPNGATIDGAKVIEADIPCANGIIHVIDTVIPPVEQGLLELLKKDERFSTLVSLLELTGLDLAVASSTEYTIFAPVNEAWKKEPYASLLAQAEGDNREALYGLLARHVITGKHVSENCLPYTKLRTIHGAPIYLTRSEEGSKISGITISETDQEGFNGLINAIDAVIPDTMELPEASITAVDAIQFVQDTLTEGSARYARGEYESSWRYYTARGYEFLSKYSAFTGKASSLRTTIADDQPVYQFAKESWASRNAFRTLLRELEKREDNLQDNYLMNAPKGERFGR